MPSEATARLLNAAVSVFALHGFEGARVSEIARRAGLTTGAIYARWPDKAGLLAAAAEHALSRVRPMHTPRNHDATAMRAHDMIELFGADLADTDEARDVMIQAAASTAANDAIAASLAGALNTRAEQLTHIIDARKQADLLKPDIDTAALTLLVQAVGIGAHLVLSAGLDASHVPAKDKWDALLGELIRCVAAVGACAEPHTGL